MIQIYAPLFFFSLLHVGASPSLEIILEKYYVSVNQSARTRIKTFKATGTFSYFMNDNSYKISEPEINGGFQLQIEKNDSYYEKVTYQHANNEMMTHQYLISEGKAWKKDAFGLNPWLFGSADSINVKRSLDLEGPLYHWKAKGHDLQFIGRRKVEDKWFYCLKLKTKDGYTEYDYLDEKTCLIAYRSFYKEFDGTYSTSLYRYSDYKKVGGIPFAHTQTHKVFMMGNKTVNVRTVSKIELDQSVVKTINR